MKKFLLPWMAILSASCLFAQKTDFRLQKKVEALFSEFQVNAGVYIKCMRTGKVVSINSDTLFPTASMIKISILAGIMDKLERRELEYHQVLVYKDSLLYKGVDILGSFKNDEKIELSKVMMLMLTMSDNTASLWLQSLAGTGSRINEILQSAGLTQTRVNTRTSGREANREIYGWGQTTPREMVTLMEKIYRGELISKKSSKMMLRLLGRNYWDEIANSQIPPEIFVASKGGALDESRSETLLVMAPSGPYIFCVATKNLADQTWEPNNTGWVLARKLSRQLWDYFEPGYNWEPYLSTDGK